MFVLRGTVVTLRPDGEVLSRGAVYVGDDGLIAAVTPGDDVPPGFENAPRITAGGVIYPGLIDLHNHLMYNSLPLWTEPARKVPWTSHNQWGGAPTYSDTISKPARLLGAAAGRALLRYVETRAIVGGTTSIQGNPRGAVPPDNDLIRNVDSEKLGTREDFIRVSTLVADSTEALASYVTAVQQGRGFIAHTAEGTDPKLRKEFQLLDDVGVVKRQLVAIHGGALTADDFANLQGGGSSLVWSPFSNYWLYGATADVTTAKAKGVRLCIGSDWGPSGTRNVLWELKVADLWNKAQPQRVFTDEELVRMATSNPGEALSGVWPHPVGRIEKGALADLIVVGRGQDDVHRNLIAATEADIRLVVVGGRARYGLRALMSTLAPAATRISVGRLSRAIDYGDPAVTWKSVVGDLEKVRKNPEGAAERAVNALTALAAGGVALEDSFVLLPDMPAPEVDVDARRRNGPVAEAPAPVKVPPPEPLTTGPSWFDAVDANPFHQGLLSGLRDYA
ncbi:cytosine/adenosine deaminase-related metal-dependent hydrolase [Kribbella orskensis]|uniref:Cytosine/adenosine deaminase-related metal-dependent hydrolase n=1 Tax=Kribbella orskensis TaxID=2512216 RepID=A0ABY2BVP6_9ACTN|nr:amidohydrolase family protein [Kribbella orskensis]TCO32340.1 cytosine/adenosine deaminase-related metal-dependent hydrolase [Kribbella orskensis]